MKKELSQKAKDMRNKYFREWRAKNKDKVKRYNDNYWANKVERLAEKEGDENDRR